MKEVQRFDLLGVVDVVLEYSYERGYIVGIDHEDAPDMVYLPGWNSDGAANARQLAAELIAAAERIEQAIKEQDA
jgi:hypothetical protein